MIKWLIDILFGWVPYIPKAMWHMWSLDRNGTTWYKIRAFVLLILTPWIVIGGIQAYSDYQSFSIPYPEYEELMLNEGNLTQIKYGKNDVDLAFINKNRQATRIKGGYVLYPKINRLFYDTQGNYNRFISLPVKMRWFKMPSGLGWIAELEIKNIRVVTYSQGKSDYMLSIKKVKEKAFFMFCFPFLFLLAIIFFEASILREKFKLGDK